MAAASDVIYLTIVAMETTWFHLIESTNEACYMYPPPPPPQGFL